MEASTFSDETDSHVPWPKFRHNNFGTLTCIDNKILTADEYALIEGKVTIPIIQTMSVVPEDSIIFKSNYCDSLLNEADHESFQEDQIMNRYPKSNAASPQHKNQSRDIFHKF